MFKFKILSEVYKEWRASLLRSFVSFVCVWRSSAEEGSETYQYNSIQSFSPGAH